MVSLVQPDEEPEVPPLEEFGDDGGGGIIDISAVVFAAYLAGLIDADGTIVWNIQPRPKKPGKPQTFSRTARISITMCDLDVLESVHKHTGLGHIYVEKKVGQGTKGHQSKKTAYRWAVHKREEIQQLVECVLPYMGTRKGSKMLELYNLIIHWDDLQARKKKRAEAKAK